MMRYRRNGKQVLRDGCVMAGGTHIADCLSEDVAELIVEALNNFDHPLDMFVPEGPDLFGLNVMINPDVPPGTVRFIHPDGRADDYVWDDTPVEVEPPRCSIRQYADQYACATHKTQWGVNDTPPDSCEVP